MQESKAHSLWWWITTTLVIGGSMVAWALSHPVSLPGLSNPAPVERNQLVLGGGCGLIAVAFLVWALRSRLAVVLGSGMGGSRESPTSTRPGIELLLISFVVLFVELMFIRYCSSQIRIFSFYKNVPLISCFLGLGLGCCLGKGRPKHALGFLLWMVPLSVFLGQGVLALDSYLGSWAAHASSEHILGDTVAIQTGGSSVLRQVLMGFFCVAMMVAITLLFAKLGRLLASAFEALPRLTGYTLNILGSLAGILTFLVMSYLQTPPWVWFLLGLGPLLFWVPNRSQRWLAVVLVLVNSLAVLPDYGTTIWSRYQKLVGFNLESAGGESRYLVQISDVFYQIAMDLGPRANAARGGNPFPHYDGAYSDLPTPERVLIVGSGTGNDVAAALRAGASFVDAVDIDPAIVAMGRQHHPEDPYGDPRVRVIVDDARSAFRKLPVASYDAVIFGLLDSHTQLGISSVRLDNYVFTVESFEAARRLLRPGGHLIISAATFRPWFKDRMRHLLDANCQEPVAVVESGFWTTYRCQAGSGVESPATRSAGVTVPTDDWPFLYLPERGIPGAYLMVVVFLAVAAVVLLAAHRSELDGFLSRRFSSYQGHLFFLGAAFLLMEVYAINRLALLFGTTWLVSAITIAVVLLMIVAANLTLMVVSNVPYGLAYPALVVTLVTGYQLEPSLVLGSGLPLTLAYAFVLLLPIYFAGLIFARSFSQASLAGPAIGANILGSVVGGWVEYATMAVGIRAMAMLALIFYLASLLGLLRWRAASATDSSQDDVGLEGSR